MAKPTQGPSPSFGTRTVTEDELLPAQRRAAVRTVCYSARDLGTEDVSLILDILGLDPREGKSCEIHGRDCYAAGCVKSHSEEG